MHTLNSVRVRFAPSPTGTMHLGNVRAALINYLFARQKKGTFILRIEDTDPERNFDPRGLQIIEDLHWLGLEYQEGPDKASLYGPYIQSERTEIYQNHLEQLINKQSVYRCFCTPEILELKKQRQIALKLPPRYDRACLKLTAVEIEQNIQARIPFIWRFKLPDISLEINDLAKGKVRFDLKNFSDFALTRNDGSFTFLFANFVDDFTMKISHVFRGEDHLSNTACQAALYLSFNAPIPTFWHLPIIINTEGKKLSKRDFGFSLHDLRKAGFLPEALCNYLAIIGTSFKQEIMTLEELSQQANFDNVTSASQIRYDLEKLRWVNHQWIMKSDVEKITRLVMPYLEKSFPTIINFPPDKLRQLISVIKNELICLEDAPDISEFYFIRPAVNNQLIEELQLSKLRTEITSCIKANKSLQDNQILLSKLQECSQQAGIPNKKFWALIRIALTGKPEGLSIKELVSLLPEEEVRIRLETL